MSKKLLLADDSITIQKVIGITFAHEDYALTVVDNGDAALTKASAERPDLILADVLMPGKNGYEVCTAIRQDPQLRHIPVLLLTGTFEPFDEGKAKAAGADSWIAKPFESQALIDRVEELLTRAAAAPEPGPEPEPVAAPAPDTADLELAAPDAADFWGELETVEEAANVGPGLSEELWTEPGAADDIWGTVPAAGGEIETPAEDDWSGLAAELDSAVVGTEPAADEEESPVGKEPNLPEDAFSFEEPLSSAGEDSFRFEQLSPAQEDAFSFEEDPFAEKDPSLLPPTVSEQADSSWSDTADAATEWAGFEEDILPLDESDILEEEDLEEIESSTSADMAQAYGLIPVEDDSAEEIPGLPAEEFVFPPETAETASPEHTGAEEFLFEEEGFPIGGELPPIDEPEWGLPVEEADLSHPIAGAESEISELLFGDGEQDAGTSSAPETAVAVPTPTAVEKRIAALSDEEIGRIVEKVAGPVIERLAQALLEKVAWEVVPDLAESMIRDEIRKIRESVAR